MGKNGRMPDDEALQLCPENPAAENHAPAD